MSIKLVKKLIALAAVAAMALPLAACGNTSAAQGSTTANGDSGNVRTITAVTGASPAPYIFREGDQITGQNYELVQAIFKKLPQYNLKWQTADFTALFPGLDSGRYQIGVNSFAKNAEREQKYLFSDPIYSEEYVVEVPKDSDIKADEIKTLGDLAGKTALLDPGTAMATAVENWNKKNPDKKIVTKYTGTGSDISSKFRQVEGGQADFTIDDLPLFTYYTKKQKFNLKAIKGGAEFNAAMGRDSYCYLIFPKGEEQLVKDVNKALAEVIADGTSKQLNEKWFGADLSANLKKG